MNCRIEIVKKISDALRAVGTTWEEYQFHERPAVKEGARQANKQAWNKVVELSKEFA